MNVGIVLLPEVGAFHASIPEQSGEPGAPPGDSHLTGRYAAMTGAVLEPTQTTRKAGSHCSPLTSY
ncbi:hypothetical protein F4561_000260 [Lipingzhangella halophila]|uniref:Uncharacterized protein n=1 Tax=Lipingzhangella halophila TaxID=1783352 RepID=A0A7W7RCF0_9ACTN|nr:hypothetical protein [Lipingzhangella halophila]